MWISDPILWIAIIVMFAAGFVVGYMVMERKASREFNDFLDDLVRMAQEKVDTADEVFDQEKEEGNG